MTTKRTLIIGASAPDTVKLIEAINRSGEDKIVIEGFLDDDPKKQGAVFMGYPIFGEVNWLESAGECFVVNNVAGDMKRRQSVAARISGFASARHLTLVHPSVDTARTTIGEGCMIQEGVVLGGEASIGDHCVLYARCIIGHESVLGDFVFVANQAIVGARSNIGSGTFVGLGSILLPYLQVGPWATIGAGSVVLRNVATGTAVFGNPARVGIRPAALEAEAS